MVVWCTENVRRFFTWKITLSIQEYISTLFFQRLWIWGTEWLRIGFKNGWPLLGRCKLSSFILMLKELSTISNEGADHFALLPHRRRRSHAMTLVLTMRLVRHSASDTCTKVSGFAARLKCCSASEQSFLLRLFSDSVTFLYNNIFLLIIYIYLPHLANYIPFLYWTWIQFCRPDQVSVKSVFRFCLRLWKRCFNANVFLC